jgi:hypothetical protein
MDMPLGAEQDAHSASDKIVGTMLVVFMGLVFSSERKAHAPLEAGMGRLSQG